MHKAEHHPDHGEGAPEVLPTDLETQRATFFGAEYKPQATINFAKIKEFIIKSKNHAWTMKEYKTPPDVLCDYCIEQGITCAITDLERLAPDQKKCLADVLLEIAKPETIHQQFGEAMLFRVWHWCYYYSNKREQLVAYMVKNTSLGTNDRYRFLQKAYDA